MKKFLFMLGLCSVSSAYAQGGMLIIQNFTTNYDFHGIIYANNNSAGAGGCYPMISSKDPEAIVVPAGATAKYEDYRHQFASSISPVTTWNVSLGPGSSVSQRPWNHASLIPGGVISANTKWSMCKFQMYHAGTSVPQTYFNGDIGGTALPCNTAPDNVATAWGNAKWFTVTSGTDVYTYLIIQ
ncbi:hypothetical protein [Chryseobacterium vrystaatense]|uniref:Uncharacterized protein n=1 Tax=Chryseobacterium vrystaatense TaxID=307480 RepID=A0ABR4UIS2_9FLAO|nr:hypothetical protein [Chryseobacterium vrystaatense]KFF24598.1 hypothetical protein IW16_19985 [Chryseobacterium vrystaatense]